MRERKPSGITNEMKLYMLIEMCSQGPIFGTAKIIIEKFNFDKTKLNNMYMFGKSRDKKSKFELIQEALTYFTDFQKDFLNQNKDLPRDEFYSRWVNNGWHANSEFIRYLLTHGRPINTKIENDKLIVKQNKEKAGADIMLALEDFFIKMEHAKEFFYLFQKYYDKNIKARKLEELSSPLRGMVELAIREGFIQEE